MALPPQALEKLVQEPAASQGAYKEFLIFSGGLFVLMLVLHFGLTLGYTAYLQGAVANLQSEINAFAAKPADQQVKAANFYSQLANLGKLLQNHTGASPALALVERTVSPDIYYTKFNLNAALNTLDLTGNARSLAAAAAEAAALGGQTGVDHVNFTSAGQQNGLWQFSITVYFTPDFLLLSSQANLQVAPPASAAVGSSATSTATTTKP